MWIIDFNSVKIKAQQTLTTLRETGFVRTHNLVIAAREDERPCDICHQAITADALSVTAGGELRHLNCALCHACGKWFWGSDQGEWHSPFVCADGVPMHVSCAVCEGCGEVLGAEDTWPGNPTKELNGHRGHDTCGYCWVCRESVIGWPDAEVLVLEDSFRRIHDFCLTCAWCGNPNGERGTMQDNQEGTVCFECMTKAYGGNPNWWEDE